MCSTQALVVLTLATLSSVTVAVSPLAGDYAAYPKYSYSYGVDDKLTGDHKTAHETRDGGIVKGSYSLLQPDGIIRTVEYVADPIHGFQAKVINSPGLAVHAVAAKKVLAPVVPIIPYGGGYSHAGPGYGAAIAPVVKPVLAGFGYGAAAAVKPALGLGYGYGGAANGGFGYGAAIAPVVKPAAVAYTQAYGPGIPHGGFGYGGSGYAGAGYAGPGYAGAGYAGPGYAGAGAYRGHGGGFY